MTAVSSGHEEIEALWRQAAEQSKAAAEQYREGAQAMDDGNYNQAHSLHIAANILLAQGRKAKYQAKAKEAEAAKCHEAAALYQQSAGQYMQAARARAAGNLSEHTRLNNEAKRLKNLAFERVRV